MFARCSRFTTNSFLYQCNPLYRSFYRVCLSQTEAIRYDNAQCAHYPQAIATFPPLGLFPYVLLRATRACYLRTPACAAHGRAVFAEFVLKTTVSDISIVIEPDQVLFELVVDSRLASGRLCKTKVAARACQRDRWHSLSTRLSWESYASLCLW